MSSKKYFPKSDNIMNSITRFLAGTELANAYTYIYILRVPVDTRCTFDIFGVFSAAR